MSHEHDAAPAKALVYGRIAATVPVTAMDRSLRFYSEVLGLQKTFENGDPVGFAILKRDAAELHLTLAKSHVASDRNLAHLLVSDAKALHDHLVAHAVPIVKALRDAPYGLRGFVFADPDGNRIDVGERL
jgi:catechol 2,3-dioxygenase-like lactoylglutathione lyase family enzyme